MKYLMLLFSLNAYANDTWQYSRDYNRIQYLSCGNELYSEQSELTLWVAGRLAKVSVDHVVDYPTLNYLAGKLDEDCRSDK